MTIRAILGDTNTSYSYLDWKNRKAVFVNGETVTTVPFSEVLDIADHIHGGKSWNTKNEGGDE